MCSMRSGSEGRLQFPYQRIGMFNAVQELSYAPDGKYLNSLSRTICSFLLSCYKNEGKIVTVNDNLIFSCSLVNIGMFVYCFYLFGILYALFSIFVMWGARLS